MKRRLSTLAIAEGGGVFPVQLTASHSYPTSPLAIPKMCDDEVVTQTQRVVVQGECFFFTQVGGGTPTGHLGSR
jgi:hypothetical protein